jgi:NAD(P)-dependent dehydrogenase (short-subunit alcohol dehydrogenase family)
MKDVVVIGAGKIGATVAGLLASTGDYQVTLADRSPEVLGNLDRDERIRIVAADVEDSLKLVDLLNGQFERRAGSCPSWRPRRRRFLFGVIGWWPARPSSAGGFTDGGLATTR